MSTLKLSDYCCQGGSRTIETTSFDLQDLTIEEDGESILRFSPLGNAPTSPRVALVGITPGSQLKRFATLLHSRPIQEAAAGAAFWKAHKKIRQMLEAHGFADVLNIHLTEDLNNSPDILTTSLVKCGLTRKSGYEYAAPEIAASAWATHCVRHRFFPDICRYSSLTHVITFGDEGRDALELIQVDGDSILNQLRLRGLVVLNFPHFANCQQRQDIFTCREEDEAELLATKPHYRAYAPMARKLRATLVNEVARLRAISP